MSVLAEIARAVDPSVGRHVVAQPGRGRFVDLVDDPARLFVLEAVYEGYLLHYGEPRAFTGMDDDLRLLAGDALYALGLSRLAEAGDTEAVVELSNLISLSAQAEAEGRPDDAAELWEQSARKLSSRDPV